MKEGEQRMKTRERGESRKKLIGLRVRAIRETMMKNKIFPSAVCEWNSIWKKALDDEKISISSQQRLSSFPMPASLPPAWQRGQSGADWPELPERSLDRKDETFFFLPLLCLPRILSQSEIRSSFFSRETLPRRKSISQSGRHFNYGAPGNCKVHGNECNARDPR